MKLFFSLLVLIAGLAGITAGQDTGKKGPADGVRPAVFTPRHSTFQLGHAAGLLTPLGYLVSPGQLLIQKGIEIPPQDTLGGTPNGIGGVYAPASGTSFDATVQNGWIPYDASIAIGPNHIVVCTNAQIEVYSRSGQFIARYSTDPASGNDFFPTNAGVAFDPKVFYDNAAGHFVILYDQEQNPLAYMNIAVSVTPDPTGQWYKYQLDWTLDGATHTGNWGDYPSLGYDNNSIYIGANQYSFANQYQYSKVRVLSKSQLYSGTPATWTDFVNLRNSDGTSAFTVKAGRMLSSSGSEYLLNTIPGGGSYVTVWRIDNAPSAPVLTRVSTVSVGKYSTPPNGRQPGGSSVATGDCRTQDLVMQNGILYEAFTEKYGTTRRNWGAGIRYLEITTSGVKNKDISYNTTGIDQYYPAVTVDPSGNMFMVFSRSSLSQYASMYQTGMKTTETAIEASSLVKAGAGTVTSGRWGDYSGIANDYTNTGAVWEFCGWAQSNGAWGTHIASASFGVAPKQLPDVASVTPKEYILNENYPNPFNPSTTISYDIPANGLVTLKVYDALGREITTLVNQIQEAGSYKVTFNANNLQSGVYFYTLTSGSFAQTKKLMLIK